MKKILLLLLLTFFFSSCEKDDICADETTPRLVLEFYDVDNPTAKKNVTNLRIVSYQTDNSTLTTDTLGTFNAESVIKLPLRITQNSTKYLLIINSTNNFTINKDNLQINYTRKEVFVSRACGYKTVFTLDSTIGIVQSETNIPDGSWIKAINKQTTNIATENEVHVKVFF